MEIAANAGASPYTEANELHRDLQALTVGRMFLLADQFVREPRRRIPKSEIKAALIAAVECGEIDSNALKDSLRSNLS